jgi:molybdopterin molybdotransferase
MKAKKMSACDISPLNNPMLPFEDAKSLMLNGIYSVTEIESLGLGSCLGRIMAIDIKSPLDMPPFDNSAMDGYALRVDDLQHQTTLNIIGTALAGVPFESVINVGECVRIMTGAQLPQGCDSVVMQELVEVDGKRVSFKQEVKKGQCVRTCGNEFKRGEVVLKRGEAISARHIALIASLGLATVNVFKKINVAIFSTGDELIALGQPLQAGQIYDSNRFSLIAQLQKMNISVTDYGVIKDDPQLIKAAFEKANLHADVVITSGGVSVGEADFTKDILQQLGEIDFWKIAMKPGKPIAFGRLSQSLFFGLPGNPVSAMVTFYQLAKPALHKLSGRTIAEPLRLLATATNDLRKSVGRLEFQRGFATTDDKGQLYVSTKSGQGSGMVGSMCHANCFIVLPQEQANITSGEQVMIEFFDNNLME